MSSGRRSGRHQRGARDQHGAAAVEFAILLPLFLLIVFGTISAGFAFSHKIAMMQAAREGARYGATLPVSNIDTWLSSVSAATTDAAGSDFTQGSPYLCVAYVAPSAASGQQQTKSLSTGASPASNLPCFTDGRTDTHVQVILRRDTQFDLVVSSSSLTLSSHAVSRYER